MKYMSARTRPRFILSSERVFGGMEFEPMLTPREKSPLPENVPRGGSNPRRGGQRAQTLPTELFRPPERHSKLQTRDVHPFEADTKGRHSSSLTFLLTRRLEEGVLTKLLRGEEGNISFVRKVLKGCTSLSLSLKCRAREPDT